jgi:hypothetical protein
MVAVGGVVNETTADRAVDGDYIQIAQTRVGTVLTGDIYDANLTSSRRTAKLEDSAAASGDALVGVAGRVNTSGTVLAADGDYTHIATDTLGGLNLANGAFGIGVYEDVILAAGETLVKNGIATQDPLTKDTGGSNDWGTLKADLMGRTITTLAPAGETWQSCTSPMTGTGDTQIKANVASNRIYVTNITCSNTAAVSSLIYFKDGSSTIYVGGVGSSTLQGVANYVNTLPVPLRLTSNTAFNAAMATTATSTTCCASGYISVN